MPSSKLFILLAATTLNAASPALHAQDTPFTNVIPACRMPAGSPLPDRYLKLDKRWKEFAWVNKVKRTDSSAALDGWIGDHEPALVAWAFDVLDTHRAELALVCA